MDLAPALFHPARCMNSRTLYLVLGCLALAGCAQTPRRAPAAAPATSPATTPAKVVKLKELAGTRWTLSVLDARPVAPSTEGWASPGLDFLPDGQSTSGFSGVNRFGGRYLQDGGTLTFGPLALTRRLGPPEQMDLESSYTRALGQVTGWRQRGMDLELIGNGRVLAVFAPRTDKE